MPSFRNAVRSVFGLRQRRRQYDREQRLNNINDTINEITAGWEATFLDNAETENRRIQVQEEVEDTHREMREGILSHESIEQIDEAEFHVRYRPPALGSAENPYSQEQMLELVGELSENENLDTNIQLRLREAFTKPGDVSYRLRVVPDDNLCKVFINEVWIIDLKGLERDPLEIGTKFLEIITRRMFATDLAHLSDEDI